MQTQPLHAHGQESSWFMFTTVQPNMNDRYRVFRRPWGVYYCEDLESGKQQSLKTRNKNEAFRLVAAKNEADASPAFSMHLARVYWQVGDPQAATRTWQQVMEEIPKLKQGSTQVRWLSAIKNAAFNPLRQLVVLETRPEHFLGILQGCNVSTNSYLRRIHCFAMDMNWLPWPVLPRKRWPVIRFKDKRAITWQEHQKILLGENNPDWRAYYELLWHLGGSQTDIARLTAEDIDWENRSIAYCRAKTGSQAVIRLDALVEEILKARPATGYLFPNIATWKHSDRAKAFIRRCKLVGVSGVSLHSYRYSWAERARKVGYPERFAQQALGHNSKAVHRAYARRAEVQVPPLGEYELKYAQGKERQATLAGAHAAGA